MKQIRFFWNRMYYGLFDYHSRTQMFLFKIVGRLTLFLLQKIDTAKREKWRVNYNVAARTLSSDTKRSTAIRIADVTMMAFTALLTWTFINLLSMFFPGVALYHADKFTFLIITAIPCLSINYLILWKKDRYLRYFKLFQKASRKSNMIWIFISMMCLVLAITMFIISLIVM